MPARPQPALRPRHVALDGEVELERAGPVAVPAVGARRPGPAVGRRRCRRSAPGARSSSTTSAGRDVAGGRGPSTPVWILPPRSSSSATSASVIDCGAALGDRPSVAVPGGDEHQSDRPTTAAVQRAEGVRGDAAEQRPGLVGAPAARRHRRRAAALAARTGRGRIGWRGTCTIGRMRSSARSSKRRPAGRTVRRQRPPSAPRPAAVSSTERHSSPASPASSGWAQSISGQRQRSPYRSRPSVAQVRRADAHRVERRAVVVQHARARSARWCGCRRRCGRRPRAR